MNPISKEDQSSDSIQQQDEGTTSPPHSPSISSPPPHEDMDTTTLPSSLPLTSSSAGTVGSSSSSSFESQDDDVETSSGLVNKTTTTSGTIIAGEQSSGDIIQQAKRIVHYPRSYRSNKPGVNNNIGLGARGLDMKPTSSSYTKRAPSSTIAGDEHCTAASGTSAKAQQGLASSRTTNRGKLKLAKLAIFRGYPAASGQTTSTIPNAGTTTGAVGSQLPTHSGTSVALTTFRGLAKNSPQPQPLQMHHQHNHHENTEGPQNGLRQNSDNHRGYHIRNPEFLVRQNLPDPITIANRQPRQQTSLENLTNMVPGAFAAAPGEGLHRRDHIRSSLFAINPHREDITNGKSLDELEEGDPIPTQLKSLMKQQEEQMDIPATQQNELQILNTQNSSNTEKNNEGPSYLPYLDESPENQQDTKPGEAYLPYLDESPPQDSASSRPENEPTTPHRGAYLIVPEEDDPSRRGTHPVLPSPLDDSRFSDEDHAHTDPQATDLPAILTSAPATDTSVFSSRNQLAEAMPVEDNEIPDMVARPYDAEAAKRHRLEKSNQNRKYFLLLALVLACIVVAVILGLRRINEPATSSPSAFPSLAPSSAPSGELDMLWESLPEHTLESLDTFNTPQNKAWEWLMNHQNISNLEDWRKKQLFALATFFFAFQGPNWNKVIGERWMDYKMEECQWFSSGYGNFLPSGEYYEYPHLTQQTPSCNEEGEFISLFLEDLQLSGLNPSMPREIALLTLLTTITLDGNDIDAPSSNMLISELFLMTKLTSLSFSTNNLTGPIPSVMGLMSNLEDLHLNHNTLTGRLPSELGLMSSMQDLWLDHNNLNGPIPSELGMITGLYRLDLRDNILTGAIPAQLLPLFQTTKVNLKRNGNFILPTEIGLLTTMTELKISDNRDRGPLDENALTGKLPSELGLMTSLTSLYLNENALTGQLPSELVLIANLTELQLSSNALTGQLPSELPLIANLTELQLRFNDLTGQIPSELGLMTSLKHLHLGNNGLSGQLPSELALMTSLSSLSLSKNVLTGQVPSELGLMNSLEWLTLYGNALTGQLPSQLGMMTNVWYLKLSRNDLTGQLPSELGMMTSLTELYLQNNDLTGQLPSQLGMMTNVWYLKLSHNDLTASIPSQLALITNLQYLRLENNTLTGAIPSELELLAVNGSLKVLTLANNSFSGTVPEGLCSLGLYYASLPSNFAYGLGLSFDCSDQLCGCCWCPCPGDNYDNYCKTHHG